MGKNEISVFNTITKQYEKVEVTPEVYEFYKRDTWRVEKQVDEYNRRRVSEDDIEIEMESMEGVVQFCKQQFDIESVKADEEELLYAALNSLEEDDRALINALFFEKMTETTYAGLYGISHQAVHKRKVRILNELREKISRNF